MTYRNTLAALGLGQSATKGGVMAIGLPRSLSLSLLISIVLTWSGCTVGSSAWLYPQSHFDYPNSNVVPLGRVQGEATGSVGLIPTSMDADLMEEAIQKALQQKGGDLLVDYTGTTIIKMYPLVFLNLYQTTFMVEGTAAKMEVGKQILH